MGLCTFCESLFQRSRFEPWGRQVEGIIDPNLFALCFDLLVESVGCDRQFIDSDANCVVDGVANRRKNRKQRSLSSLLRTERPLRIVALNDDWNNLRHLVHAHDFVIEQIRIHQMSIAAILHFFRKHLTHAHVA